MQSEHPAIDSIRGELVSGATKLADNARRLYRRRALVVWTASCALLLGGLLTIDVMLRREEVGLRCLSLAALVGCASWLASRLLRPAWRFSPTPVDVAKWIEDSRPEDGHGLSTAIQLAQISPGDLRFGSQGFRDSALRGWYAEHAVPKWNAHLDTRKLWPAMAALAAVVGLLTVMTVLRPRETQLALLRLALPWSDHRWPREDALVLNNPPLLVAMGTELQLEISDAHPPLPERVDVLLREVGRASVSEELRIPTAIVGDLAIANLPKLESAVEVRAMGGDDDSMPWHRIEVVQPPILEEFQFEIDPPAYTQRESYTLVGRRIQVLVGSTLRFSGRFGEPLSKVESLQFGNVEGLPPAADWESTLTADKRSFILAGSQGAPKRIEQSLRWKLGIETQAGLKIELPEPWSVEALPDAVPVVVLQQPEINLISAQSVLALRGRATDDLGLTRIDARVQTLETEPPLSVPILADSLQEPPLSFVIEHLLDVAGHAPSEGIQLTVWLEAVDTLGQVGKSQPQRFSIRSLDEILFAIQNRQTQLLDQVRQLVETQSDNQQLTDRTASQITAAAQPRSKDATSLQTAAEIQKAIAQQLSGAAGVAQSITTTLELLELNRLGESEAAAELQAIGEMVGKLAAGEMLEASAQALNAAQTAQDSLAGKHSVRQAAEAAQLSAGTQTRALNGLRQLLDRLSREEALQQLQRELAHVLEQQEMLQSVTDQLQLESLSNKDQAWLADRRAGLYSDQHALARGLDDLLQRAKVSAQAGAGESPSRQQDMKRAEETLVREQASQRMRDAAQLIEDERFASATTLQQRVRQSLEDALQQLGGNRHTSPARNLENQANQLLQSSQDLAQLADRQADLAEQMDASGAAERTLALASAQADLNDATVEQSLRAEQAANTATGSSLAEAIQAQQQVAQALDQGTLHEAAREAQLAAEKLRQAAEETLASAERLGQQARQQQVFQLAQALKQLSEEQAPIVDRLGEFDSSVPAGDRHLEIANEQEALRLRVVAVRRETLELPTFDWTLEQVEADMSKAIASARRLRIQPEAYDAASDALRKLTMAAEAVESQAAEASAPSPNRDATASEQANAEPRLVPPIASLKLIRALQADIGNQTVELDRQPDQALRSQALRDLSRQQRALQQQLQALTAEN